jgi:hypothetical protein
LKTTFHKSIHRDKDAKLEFYFIFLFPAK